MPNYRHNLFYGMCEHRILFVLRRRVNKNFNNDHFALAQAKHSIGQCSDGIGLRQLRKLCAMRSEMACARPILHHDDENQLAIY